MTDRPIKISLINHSTRNDNLGVGALTVSEVEILRDIAREVGREIKITIVDWKDRRTPYVEGADIRIVDLDKWMKYSPSGFLRLARQSDLVIDIGAGDSFADIYGSSRIRRMFWLKGLVHLSGTPLVMAPQTIGPFRKGWSRRLARWTMQRSALVVSRDRFSTEAARDLGAKDVIEASDVALRLPYDPLPPREPGAAPKVGINISGLLMAGGYTGKNEFGVRADYHELMRELIRYFQEEGCEVHLVGHVLPENADIEHGEDDAAANRVLAREFPDVVLAPHFRNPSEAKSYISGMDFFLGARMHACIAAFSSGVPVIPMAYSRKFAGLFGTIGYDYTVDCTRETSEEIMAKVATAWSERTEMKRLVTTSLQTGLEKLAQYETGLSRLIAGLNGLSDR